MELAEDNVTLELCDAQEDAVRSFHLESEAREWQIRCLKAESAQRLWRQKCRGDRHPSWPSEATRLRSLQEELECLEAKIGEVETCSKTPWTELSTLQAGCFRVDVACNREEEAVASLKQELREEKRLVRGGTSSLEDEALAFAQTRVDQLRLHISRIESSASNSRCATQKFKENAERQGSELELLAQRCSEVATEADSKRAAAERRSEIVATQIKENEIAWQGFEEAQASEQRQLEKCRTELTNISATTVEITEQMRRSKFGHGQQLQAVRQGGEALREALAESDIDRHESELELEEARASLEAFAAVHASSEQRECEAAKLNCFLDDEIHETLHQLDLCAEEHAVVSTSIDSYLDELSENSELCAEFTTEHKQSLENLDGSSSRLQSLKKDVNRLQDEFGAVASRRRRDEAESRMEEIAGLNAERSSLRQRHANIQSGTNKRQRLRDRQSILRQAAADAASQFKASYTEILREARLGKSKGGVDAVTSVGFCAKKLGRYIDNFVQFLEGIQSASLLDECPKMSETGCNAPETYFGTNSSPKVDVGGTEPNVDGLEPTLWLPTILVEAYATAHERTPVGVKHAERLAAERQKAQSIRSSTKDANAAHTAEMGILKSQIDAMQEKIAQCKDEALAGKSDKEKSSASDQSSPGASTVQIIGLQETEKQVTAALEVQDQLRTQTAEISALRREYEQMQHTLGTSPGGEVSAESTQEQFQSIDQELVKSKEELTRWRSRYVEMVDKAGGWDAVSEAGLPLPPIRGAWWPNFNAISTTTSPQPPSPAFVEEDQNSMEADEASSDKIWKDPNSNSAPRAAVAPVSPATDDSDQSKSRLRHEADHSQTSPPKNEFDAPKSAVSADIALDAVDEAEQILRDLVTNGTALNAAGTVSTDTDVEATTPPPSSPVSRASLARGTPSRGMSWADVDIELNTSVSPTKLNSALASVRADEELLSKESPQKHSNVERDTPTGSAQLTRRRLSSKSVDSLVSGNNEFDDTRGATTVDAGAVPASSLQPAVLKLEEMMRMQRQHLSPLSNNRAAGEDHAGNSDEDKGRMPETTLADAPQSASARFDADTVIDDEADDGGTTQVVASFFREREGPGSAAVTGQPQQPEEVVSIVQPVAVKPVESSKMVWSAIAAPGQQVEAIAPPATRSPNTTVPRASAQRISVSSAPAHHSTQGQPQQPEEVVSIVQPVAVKPVESSKMVWSAIAAPGQQVEAGMAPSATRSPNTTVPRASAQRISVSSAPAHHSTQGYAYGRVGQFSAVTTSDVPNTYPVASQASTSHVTQAKVASPQSPPGSPSQPQTRSVGQNIRSGRVSVPAKNAAFTGSPVRGPYPQSPSRRSMPQLTSSPVLGAPTLASSSITPVISPRQIRVQSHQYEWHSPASGVVVRSIQ